jgi:tetratricopeptide (TPR) repeat protein
MTNVSETDAYKKAWAGEQRLLRMGKSFSGREKNCVFLNTGGGVNRFATLSAATGIDYPDDGRGLALCDWDHDGRVDLWSVNRSGPRVRLMMNRWPGGNEWLQLRVRGDGKKVNRDGIGARLEVHLKGAAAPLIRTVYAGSGFLSQSSYWQHFGLGKGESIEKVVVRWPNGPAEEFRGCKANAHFVLELGKGAAKPWSPPDKEKRTFAAQTVANDERTMDGASLKLISPMALPASFLPAPREKASLPYLLCLWSKTCPNCEAQIRDWAADADLAAMEMVLWCLDADQAEAEKVAAGYGWKGKVISGKSKDQERKAAIWNAIHKSFMSLLSDLPVPSSFVLTSRQELVYFSKGPVAAARLPDLMAIAEPMSFSARLQSALPEVPRDSGVWFDEIRGTGITPVVGMLLDAELNGECEELAIAHVEALRKLDKLTKAEETWRNEEIAAALRLKAIFARDRRDYGGAEGLLKEALDLAPSGQIRRDLITVYHGMKDKGTYPKIAQQLEELLKTNKDPDTMAKLGILLLDVGRPEDGLPLLEESARLRPDPAVLFQLGQTFRATGQISKAAEAWERSLQENPNLVPSLNNLSWLRSTVPEESLRKPQEAIFHAEKAVELTKRKNPLVIATLAIAQASAGNFEKALSTLEESKAIYQGRGDQQWLERLAKWQQMFQRKEPVRE